MTGLATSTAGSLYVAAFTAPIGPQLRVRLTYLTTTNGTQRTPSAWASI